MTNDNEFPKPDLCIGPIWLWALERAFPSADNSWDADELCWRLLVETERVTVAWTDFGISSSKVRHFQEALRDLHETLEGEAWLDGSEFGLILRLAHTSLGHIEVIAQFLFQPEWSELKLAHQIDQSYLPTIIAQCDRILERFPVQFQPRGVKPR